MSWLSENYDKAALGVAGIAAIAIGYSIFSGGEEVEAPKVAVPNNTVEIEERKILAKTIETFSTDYEFESILSNGNEVTSFVSTPLYSIKGKEGITPLTDEYEIHPGMPLKWWREYNLEAYRLNDAPEVDSDEDGFDNRAEYDAGTDPTDAESHPNFIAKLKCTEIKEQSFTLNWTKVSDVKSMFTFKISEPKGKLRRDSKTTMTGVDSTFPEDVRAGNEFYQNRFKIIEKKQDPDISGERGEYYILEDTAELNNKGRIKLYYGKRMELIDSTAVFFLDIDGMETSFEIPLDAKFSLPHDDDTKAKDYTFKSINEGKVEIEYELEGNKKSVELVVTPRS